MYSNNYKQIYNKGCELDIIFTFWTEDFVLEIVL